eukprot:gene6828-1221_t
MWRAPALLVSLAGGSAADFPRAPLQGIRAPATPLWVHSPYVNYWATTDNLTDSWPWHVRNDKVSSLSVLLRVGGKAYELIHGGCTEGAAPATQLGPPSIYPTTTLYRFEAGGVLANLSFTSPKFIDDLDSWVPVLVLSVSVASIGPPVPVYFDVAGQHTVDVDNATVVCPTPYPGHSSLEQPGVVFQLAAAQVWRRDNFSWLAGDGAHSMQIGTKAQNVFDEYPPGSRKNQFGSQPVEHLNWGYAHLSIPRQEGSVISWLGSSNVARASFASSGRLPDADEAVMPLQTSAVDLGQVAASPLLAYAIVSSDDLGHSVRYFGKSLPEYWRRSGRTFESMLGDVVTDVPSTMRRCADYDSAMLAGFRSASDSEDFTRVASLSYRQVLGDNSLVWYDGSFRGATPPSALMFVKGLGSSGDTGTIDDNYPASLLYLWGQPELLNALLRPINMFAGGETYGGPSAPFPRNLTWGEGYCIHYLGQYPVAEMQCWGLDRCEPMPLEMSADNIQMLAAAALATGDTATIDTYYPLLKGWADYLVANGLRPAKQLCSDDFEGPTALNANLAAKSILGIAAFSSVCEQLGKGTDCGHYASTAKNYSSLWPSLATGGPGEDTIGHTRRGYNVSGSWSLKYNLVWDKVFGYGMFSGSIGQDCDYYMSDASPVRRKFGWYLDDRSEGDSRHLANHGWTEWIAAMCGPEAQGDLYGRLVKFAESTPDRWALTDYADADTGRRIGFEGRAQMGGFGATLALKKWPGGMI